MATSISAPRPSALGGRTLPLGVAALYVTLVGLDLRPGIVSIGPLMISLSKAFGLSHTLAALLTAIPDVLMGGLAIVSPALARRYGRDRVILAALLLLFVASASRSFVDTRAGLFLSTAGVGAGIAIAGALVGGFVKAALPQRPALLIGVYTAALSLGSTLAAGVTGPVAVAAGTWRPAAFIWSMLGLPALAAWIYVERRAVDRRGTSSARIPFPVRNARAWLIGTFFAAQNFLFYAIISWIVPVYVDFGVSPVAAGLVLAEFTGSFFVANIVAGMLSRQNDRRLLLALFAALAATGTFALAIVPTVAPSVTVPAIAFGLGGCFTLGMTLPLDATGNADEANVWGAFMTLIAYLIAATGPVLVGAIRDATGTFSGALWLLFAIGLLMVAHTPFLGGLGRQTRAD